MEAFIPCGPALSSSRTFLTGDTAISSKRRSAPTRKINGDIGEISAIKLPNMPSMPNIPNMPNLPNPFKKPEAPSTRKLSTDPVALKIGGETVVPVPKSVKEAAEAAAVSLEQGLPKFYNDSTARHQFAVKAAGQCATVYDVREGLSGVKPTNVRANDQGGFRNMDPYTDDLLWARPGWSSDEARVGVRVALRNVFGNANLFESDLAELEGSISCVTKTADIREFVRAIGQSDAYRSRFFEPCSNMRFVELSFKHFLGRAPNNQAEVSAQIEILTTQGYNAAINAIIDSDEYDRLFGRSRIPAVNFRGGHPSNNDMNKTAVLNGSYVSSDRVSTKAFLQTGDSAGSTSFSVYKGLPEAWRGENEARNAKGPLMAFPDSVFWNLPAVDLRSAEIAWNLRFGKWTKFWYKDSIVFQGVMEPQLKHSAQEEEEAAATLKYGSLMGSKYVGSRKLFDMAPIITITKPAGSNLSGGVEVRMQKIEPAVPRELARPF